MSIFDDLIQNETIDGVRAQAIAFAQAAGLRITDWVKGSVGEQIFEATSELVYAGTQTFTRAVRGFASLDTSTDPGDYDAFDAGNAKLTPGPGFLSYFGQNTFGTTRENQTFASGTVAFHNAGPGARTLSPGQLVLTWTNFGPPSPAPTYRTTPDPSIYVGPGGTLTVPVGSTVTLPIQADEAGTRSNVAAGALTLTTTLTGCTATNAGAVLGTDREDADVYRVRCRQAPSRVSLGGPSAAYQYFSAKNIDGTPLLNSSSAAVNINRVFVSADSPTGIVNAYYAAPSGAPIAADVDAANANIAAQAFAVPDAITFTGAAAIAVPIKVHGLVKLKVRPGITSGAVKDAIVRSLDAAFANFPIGGVDSVNGAGVVYTTDILATVAKAYVGIYDVTLTLPAGVSTAIALGHVATVNTSVGDWAVVLVP
jgi:hypothetical protein